MFAFRPVGRAIPWVLQDKGSYSGISCFFLLLLATGFAIEAEERERNRIAKDLHEDTGQHLALLAKEIEQLENDLPNRNVELLDRMDAAWKLTLEILTDVKASACEMYSPRLEYLAVAAVMRIFCEEFGERKKVEMDFRSHGLPSLVQQEVSICLFRVLREALDNTVKHSGVQKFSMQLLADDEIHLTVTDSGPGFDLEAGIRGRGLGQSLWQIVRKICLSSSR
jgi:signal transduction histidine kinase